MKALRIILIVFAAIFLLLILVVSFKRQPPAKPHIQSSYDEHKDSLTIVKDVILNDYQSLQVKDENHEMYDLDLDLGEMTRYPDVEIVLNSSEKEAIKDLEDLSMLSFDCVYAYNDHITFVFGVGGAAYIFQLNENIPDNFAYKDDIFKLYVYRLADNWFYAKNW